MAPELTAQRPAPPPPPPMPEPMPEVEPDLDEPEVMLEPDDTMEPPVEVSTLSQGPNGVNLLEDDTFSPPPPPPPGQRPPSISPELPSLPPQVSDPTVQTIRQTLESTGDLKPQVAAAPGETFLVPPAAIEEARVADEDLDALSDFEIPDDDSLDIAESDSMDLGQDLLDDLDDE